MEREKPAISLGWPNEPDFFYTYGGTDGKGEPLYSTALMALEPAAFKHKPSACDDSVTALVDSGASGHYFDDPIIPGLKHRLLNYVLPTTPRKILTAGGALLDCTAEGTLQGIVTDNHGEHHLARITILIVPGIGCNLFSVKSATKKGIVSTFDFDNPRLELSGITVPLRADDDIYSLAFYLSAESHGGKELAMNAMVNAQLWHRRLRHLNKRSLELMQRRDGNRVAFDGSIDHFDVCAVRNVTNWLTLRRLNTPTSRRPLKGFIVTWWAHLYPRLVEATSTRARFYQIDRSLLALHQEPSPCVATAIRHFNHHSVRQPYRHLASRQGR